MHVIQVDDAEAGAVGYPDASVVGFDVGEGDCQV
jgi:hypothetical protein